MSGMLVYDVRFPDGTVKQFGSRRGIGTVAEQIRTVLPTATEFRRHNISTDWREL